MKKIYFLILFLPSVSLASLELGVGMNSTHSGRVVPSMAAALAGGNWALSGFSSGVKNSYYYHSNYGLGFYGTTKAGDLWGGEVVFGFGLGTMYAERGFQDEDASSLDKKSDLAIGPAIRLNWTVFSFMFVNIEALYGIRDVSHLALNFQDVISTSVGVRLW